MGIARAEADLARLQADMVRLRAQLADVEEQSIKVKHYIEVARRYEAGEGLASVSPRTRGSNADYIARVARETLKESGEPMQTRALVDDLTQRGVRLGGSNPMNYVSSVLSRSPDFENDRVSGWHLTSWKTAMNTEPAAESALDTSGDDDDDETAGM